MNGYIGTKAQAVRLDTYTKKQVDGMVAAQASALQTFIYSEGQISTTDSITLNGTTDNTVVMTNIVTALGLEVGDVIRIDTGAYNKLHTVESITNSGSIIVNYEHAGNRGDGSLKLPDFTGQATVTRIAKWFNAPIGLGQAWVDQTASRTILVAYTAPANRSMMIAVALVNASGTNAQVLIDGTLMFNNSINAAGPNPLWPVIPRGATYEVAGNIGDGGTNVLINTWSELR